MIPGFHSLFTREVAKVGEIGMFVADNAANLRKCRIYIEQADVLLVDLEGDQLGPKGEITLVQINTYQNEICFLIDIKLLGDQILRKKDGWLRQALESSTKVFSNWKPSSN